MDSGMAFCEHFKNVNIDYSIVDEFQSSSECEVGLSLEDIRSLF